MMKEYRRRCSMMKEYRRRRSMMKEYMRRRSIMEEYRRRRSMMKEELCTQQLIVCLKDIANSPMNGEEAFVFKRNTLFY